MGIVSDIMTSLDNAVGQTGAALFENAAQMLAPMVTIVTTLMLVVVGIAMAAGTARLGPREGLGIMVRIIIVFMFGQSWANFGMIYDALANGLQNLGFSMFEVVGGGLGQPNAVSAMDDFGGKTQSVTNEVIRAQSSITRGIIAGLLFCLLAIFNAAYIVVVGFAKIMVAVLVAVAPLAILTILFEKTKNLFEAWLSALVGYSLWPVAAAAVVATITFALDSITIPDAERTRLAAMLAFFVLSVVAVFATLQIPSAVSNITGQINLANLGSGAGAVAGAAAGGAGKVAKMTAGQAVSGAFRGGQTAQQYNRSTMVRGNSLERGAAELGNRMTTRLRNSSSRSISNIASVAKR